MRLVAVAAGTSFMQTTTFTRASIPPSPSALSRLRGRLTLPRPLVGSSPSDANRSTMPRGHRTTSRSILTLLVLGLLAGTANAAPPKQILFPVVGPAKFQNDFGAPRGGGRSHRGNDIMADRAAPVVAVEAGRI